MCLTFYRLGESGGAVTEMRSGALAWKGDNNFSLHCAETTCGALLSVPGELTPERRPLPRFDSTGHSTRSIQSSPSPETSIIHPTGNLSRSLPVPGPAQHSVFSFSRWAVSALRTGSLRFRFLQNCSVPAGGPAGVPPGPLRGISDPNWRAVECSQRRGHRLCV